MANFSALKTAIQNAIRTNGNNEITGQMLQDVLLSMVVALGDDAINDIASDLNSITTIINNITNGYVYAGIATPSTTPVSGKVFYVAVQAGTYTNLGNTVVKPGISILKYNGSAWSNEQVIYTDGGVFDVSAYNGGATYVSLEALLSDANLSTIIPSAVRKGGMSIKFVQSSDNKYVQFRYMSNDATTAATFTNVSNWQGVDGVPTPNSNNLIKSNSVFDVSVINDINFNTGREYGDMRITNMLYFGFSALYNRTNDACIIFPADNISYIQLTAKSNLSEATGALVTSLDIENPTYTRMEVTSGNTGIFKVNDNVKYIVINISSNGTSLLPEAVIIGRKNDGINKFINEFGCPVTGVTAIPDYSSYAITGASFKQNHTYKVSIWSKTTFTPTGELNVKVVNSSTDTTVEKIINLQNTEISNSSEYEILFTWKKEDVDDYRVGIYSPNQIANNILFIKVEDITEELVYSDSVNKFKVPLFSSVETGRNVYSYNNITLQKGHTYKVLVWTKTQITITSETNLKIVNSTSDSTIQKIYDFNGVTLTPDAKYEISFKWEKENVTDYRIGWYTSIVFPVYTEIVDITETSIIKSIFEDLLTPNVVTIKIANATVTANQNLYFKKGYKYQIVFSASEKVQFSGTYLNIAFRTSSGTTLDEVFIPRGTIISQTEKYVYNRVWDYDSQSGYLTVWSSQAYSPNITISIVCTGEDIDTTDYENDYNNAYLVYSSRKKFLTIAEQEAIGLTPSIHYNNSNNAYQIVHVTDIHGDADCYKRAIRFANHINASLINSGDTVISEGSESIAWMDELLVAVHGEYLFAVGNHETWGLTTEQQVYEKFISPYASSHGWNLPSVSNPTYYYKDNADRKIRYIVLNEWVKYDNVSIGVPCYSQGQIDYLISTLLATPSDYGVIVVLHSPDRVLSMSEGYTKFYQKKNYNSYVGLNGIKPISTIIDAWISKTHLVTTMSNYIETLSIDADFENVEASEFIAYICGHSHVDAICYLPECTNTQLVLCNTLTCSRVNTTGNELAETSDLARVKDTKTQDAFNVYTIDRDSKTVKIVRIGSDMPFDFSEKRDCMEIPYA